MTTFTAALTNTSDRTAAANRAPRTTDVGALGSRVALTGVGGDAPRTFDERRLADYRSRGVAFVPHPRGEGAVVDVALANPFAASNAPASTGVSVDAEHATATYVTARTAAAPRAGARQRPYGWLQQVMALGGAAIVALAFGAAIFLVGSAIAAVLRMVLAAVPGLR